MADGLTVKVYAKLKDPKVLQMVAGSQQMLSQKAEQAKGPAQDALKNMLTGLKIETDEKTATVVATLKLDSGQTDKLAGQIIEGLVEARFRAKRVADASNLRQIAVACAMYANDHGGQRPEKLADLKGKYIPTPRVFVSPADEHPPTVGDLKTSYVYIGKTSGREQPSLIVAYTRKGVFGSGRNCLCSDGSVRWATEEQIQKDFARSYELALKSMPKASDEDKARLKTFFEIK